MISSSSSLAFASTELLRFLSSLTPFGASSACLGFRPSSRQHPSAATSSRRRPSPSLRSVHRLSQPLDVLLRVRARRLISSRCHVQGPPVQGLLSPRSHPSSSEGSSPHAVAPPRADRLSPAAARIGPRLRGLHPREVAFDATPLFTASLVAPLLGFVSSRPSLPSVDRSLPAISAHDVSSLRLRCSRSRFDPSPASLPREARRRVSASPACSSF